MAGAIPRRVIEEISQRIAPLEIIGRYVQLRRSGSKYLGLCPFHNEKTPSMNVDPDTGLWHCFGCHEGGNVFQFVQRMEGIGYLAAVRQLASEVGITVEMSESALQENSERLRALNLLDRATDFYHRVLLESPEGEIGREYMIQRNISRDTAVKFRLGWAPDGGRALMQSLQACGFKIEEAIKCGLIANNSYYGLTDIMRNRLIFPICDPMGKVLAFGGRSLGDSKAKYMNTPETPWYSKRNNLYGLNQAKLSIKQCDVCLLVEGYFDVISLHQAGVTTAVASCGTALTIEQAQILKRFSRNALLAYDSDEAGQKAIFRGNEVLEDVGMRAQIVRLPDGEDPDSLAQRGTEEIKKVLATAEGVVTYTMKSLLKQLDVSSPEGKEDFVRKVMPLVRKVRDSARQDAYIRKLAYYSGISEVRLHRRLCGTSVAFERSEPRNRPLTSEEKLFCLCMTTPAWISVVREIIEPDMIENRDLRPFFEALFAWKGIEERRSPITLQELMNLAVNESQMPKLAELLTRKTLQSTDEDVRKLAVAVRDRRWRERLDKLRLEIIPNIDAGKISLDDPLYKEYSELKKYFHKK